MERFAASLSDQGREGVWSEAERRGWRWHWETWDTIGGEHLGITLTNANGYRLASGGGFNMTDREAVEPDWDAVLVSLLRQALDAEDRREARRLGTRLRRASAALAGSVYIPVPESKHEPRPPRDRELERGLRTDRGLSHRQACKVARRLQAIGRNNWGDEDLDALEEQAGGAFSQESRPRHGPRS